MSLKPTKKIAVTAWEKAVITDANGEPKATKRLWQAEVQVPQNFSDNDWSGLLRFFRNKTKERISIKKHLSSEIDLFVKKGNPKKHLTKKRFFSFFNNYFKSGRVDSTLHCPG